MSAIRLENLVKKFGERLLKPDNEFLECAHGSCGTARSATGEKSFNGGPERCAIGAGRIAQRIEPSAKTSARSSRE